VERELAVWLRLGYLQETFFGAPAQPVPPGQDAQNRGG